MAYVEGKEHCTDWLSDKTLNPDQRTCIEVLCVGLGVSIYNIPTNWKKMERHYSGVTLSVHTSGFSTYDFDELTGLVVAAHKERVRVSIMPSGPRMLKIMLRKRKEEGSMSARHPGLSDLVERIRNAQMPTVSKGKLMLSCGHEWTEDMGPWERLEFSYESEVCTRDPEEPFAKVTAFAYTCPACQERIKSSVDKK